jgi:hypothetical protein
MIAKKLYRISFVNQGKVYEIFARQVMQSNLHGFIEVEQLVFNEKSAVVVDPSEERLKDEFNGVQRSYIPVHSVIRIDEVEKRGTATIRPIDSDSNVTPFDVARLPGVPNPDAE